MLLHRLRKSTAPECSESATASASPIRLCRLARSKGKECSHRAVCWRRVRDLVDYSLAGSKMRYCVVHDIVRLCLFIRLFIRHFICLLVRLLFRLSRHLRSNQKHDSRSWPLLQAAARRRLLRRRRRRRRRIHRRHAGACGSLRNSAAVRVNWSRSQSRGSSCCAWAAVAASKWLNGCSRWRGGSCCSTWAAGEAAAADAAGTAARSGAVRRGQQQEHQEHQEQEQEQEEDAFSWKNCSSRSRQRACHFN